jgi:hypothetical protein
MLIYRMGKKDPNSMPLYTVVTQDGLLRSSKET